MNNKIITYFIVLPIILLLTVSCTGSRLQESDEESSQYVNLVNGFCQKNNLAIKGYLGKTIIRSKDFKNTDVGKEPVVFEWQVINKASKQKFVIWVGPVLPQFPTIKPQVTLAKDRYSLQGLKVEEKK